MILPYDFQPRCPLVIDQVTKRARYVTQADVHRMEIICSAYRSMIEDMRGRVADADRLSKNLDECYPGTNGGGA